jgi:hypothetical protein
VKSKFDSDDDKISKNDGPIRRLQEKPGPKIRKNRLEPFNKTDRRIPVEWFYIADEDDDDDFESDDLDD